MAEKLEELKILMQYLGQQVRNTPELEDDDIRDGMMVAVYLLDDKDKPMWHRAVVKQSISTIHLVKVSSILICYHI